MKKLAILVAVSACFLLTGCHNSELKDCKSENTELKAQVADLEKQVGDLLKSVGQLSEYIEENQKNDGTEPVVTEENK